MTHVLAITFEDMEQGPAVMRTLKSLREQGQLRIDDAAVVVKDAEGKIKVDNMVESGVKQGALAGGFIGLLLGQHFLPARRTRSRCRRRRPDRQNPQYWYR